MPLASDPRPDGPRVRAALGWMLVSRGVAMAGAFGVSVVAARALGPDDFGLFVVLLTLASAVSEIALFGANRLALRDVASALVLDDRTSLATTMSMVRGVTRIAVPGAAAVGALAIYVVGDGAWLPALAFGMLVVGSAHQKLWADLLRGAGEIRWASALEGRQGGALAAGCQFLLLLGAALVAQIDLAQALALSAVGFLVPVLVARTTKPAVLEGPDPRVASLAGLGHAVRRGWAFTGTAVTSHLHANVDLWIAGVLLSSQASSDFAAAQRLVLLVAVPLATFQVVFAPVIARAHASGSVEDVQVLVRSAATVAAIVGLVGLLPMLVLPRLTLGLAFGAAFTQAAPLVVVLAVGQVGNVATGLCGVALSMTGHEESVFRLSLAASIIRVGVAVAAGMLFGAAGLAAGSATVTVAMFVVLWWWARRRLGVRTEPTLRPDFGGLLRAAA